MKSTQHSRISNSNFHLNPRFNCDGSDLLDHIRGTEKVNNTLVNSKLKSVPSVGPCKQNKLEKISKSKILFSNGSQPHHLITQKPNKSTQGWGTLKKKKAQIHDPILDRYSYLRKGQFKREDEKHRLSVR